MTTAIFYILVSVLAGAAGQLLLKTGMNNHGEVTMSVSGLPNYIWSLITNPYVVIGLVLYGSGTLFWLAALSREDLSFAYPFASLSYVVMLLGSWLLFHEDITPMRLLGAFVIMVGVFLISRT